MAKKKSPRTIPAASPEDLQATIVNHNPSRKGHRPIPLDWTCEEHESIGCMTCWWALEAIRRYNEKNIPEALKSEITHDPLVQSFLATDPGVSSSLPNQISQIFNVPLPDRKTDGIKIEEKYSPPAPQRQFYRRKIDPRYPYPDYMDWFRRNSGTLGDRMLPEDIAFLLTKGEFYYRDYAELKHNLPRQVFQSAAISYDNPSWKRSWSGQHERNPLDTQMPALMRAQETGTSAVGTGDAGIITREKPVWIAVEALPELMRVRDLNKEQRLQLVAEREKLKSEKSTSLLTGVERASHLKKCRRRIKEIDKELRALDRNWQKVRVPGTGRPAFQVQIPPCPEGSEPFSLGSEFARGHQLMRRKNFYAYIEMAFGLVPKDRPDQWDREVAALENAMLRRAESFGLLNDWEKDLNAPKEELWLRDEDIEELVNDAPCEPTALENSMTGYTRDENGQLADETIQKGALKNHGDWRWGRGRGSDKDGTDDMEKDGTNDRGGK